MIAMDSDKIAEKVDREVEAIMSDREGSVDLMGTDVDVEVEQVLRVAADLRFLPRPAFREDLRERIAREAAASFARQYGRVLSTGADIRIRLSELNEQSKMVSYDPVLAMNDLPEMSMRFLTSFEDHVIGVSRFSAQRPHWERHRESQELLHVLDGKLELTTLTETGPIRTSVSAGSLVVCPRGFWHWPRPDPEVSLLFVSPRGGTDFTVEDLPSHDSRLSDETGSIEAVRVQNGNDRFRKLCTFDRWTLGVMHFSGRTPWERHPGGDEMVHVLSGQIEVTVLADNGPVNETVQEGSFFVCPRGFWHRQVATTPSTMLYTTPVETTEVSFEDHPVGR